MAVLMVLDNNFRQNNYAKEFVNSDYDQYFDLELLNDSLDIGLRVGFNYMISNDFIYYDQFNTQTLTIWSNLSGIRVDLGYESYMRPIRRIPNE